MARPEWAAGTANNVQNTLEGAASRLGIPCPDCKGNASDGTAYCKNPFHTEMRAAWVSLDNVRTDHGRIARERVREPCLEPVPVRRTEDGCG